MAALEFNDQIEELANDLHSTYKSTKVLTYDLHVRALTCKTCLYRLQS